MFRAAFAATLGYLLASLLVALAIVAALFVAVAYGWPLLEREVDARFDASHALWCVDHASEMSCP